MKLVQFYRQLFLEAAHDFEPVWEEEKDVLFGYRWYKNNYPLTEQFQITDVHPDHPILMYSLVLPESYLQTTIYEEIKRNASSFDISLVIVNRKLWLNLTVQTEHLESSLMGFLNQARSELMNILDCLIQRTEDRITLANR